jgi:hypothetical protein
MVSLLYSGLYTYQKAYYNTFYPLVISFNVLNMEHEDLKNLIKNCFLYKQSATARELHFKIGKIYPCQEVYKVLDELESEGFIDHTVVKATKYVKPHYKYFIVQEKSNLLTQIINSISNFFKR